MAKAAARGGAARHERVPPPRADGLRGHVGRGIEPDLRRVRAASRGVLDGLVHGVGGRLHDGGYDLRYREGHDEPAARRGESLRQWVISICTAICTAMKATSY